MKSLLTGEEFSSAIEYEKAEEKNGSGVTGTANWHARRAGLPGSPADTPVWTNRLLTNWTDQSRLLDLRKSKRDLPFYESSFKNKMIIVWKMENRVKQT